MTLVAAWYRAMDGGYAVFSANDSAPNLDYRRDTEVAARTPAGAAAPATKNPRQEVQRAHLHAFYAEHDPTENQESSALAGYPVIATGHRALGAALLGDAVQVEPDSTRLAAAVNAAAQPWGGSYCSYQLGTDGPFWVMPRWDHRWTSSTGAWPGPTASPPNPTRTWAGPSTWSGPAWPTRTGSRRSNGPQPASARVSRPSLPSTD